MQILRFQKQDKGALIGTFSLKVPKWGLIVNDMSLFEGKNGSRWVSFPQKGVKGPEKITYHPLLQFENKSHQAVFSQKVIEALDEYLKSAPEASNATGEPCQMEMPF